MDVAHQQENVGSVTADNPNSYQPDNIEIAATGVYCFTGDEPFMLFGAVASNMCFSRPDPILEAPALNGDGFDPIVKCEIDDFVDAEPDERMRNCVLHAIDSVLHNYDVNIDTIEKILLHIVVPTQGEARNQQLMLDEWQEMIIMSNYFHDNVVIRFSLSGESTARQLITVSEEIDNGTWDLVLFGAVDSLVDEITCQRLARDYRVQTTKAADGVVPGEAAAFVLLRKTSEKNASGIHIKSIAALDELDAIDADMTHKQTLGNTIALAAKNATIAVDDIETLIVPHGTETTSMMEWNQTLHRIWPNMLSEEKRLAMQLGEIDSPELSSRSYPEELNPIFSYGDMGVANVLVSLVLSVARFNYHMPAITKCMICDMGNSAGRGAIYIESISDTVAVSDVA